MLNYLKKVKNRENLKNTFPYSKSAHFVEFSQGLILPTKEKSDGKINTTSKTVVKQENSNIDNPNEEKNQLYTVNEPVKIQTKKLHMKEDFKCRSSELYNVLTNINVCNFISYF